MELLVKPPNIERQGIRAFFTTKKVCKGIRPSRNLLSEEFDIPEDNIYLPVQEHTNKIHLLESGLGPVVADAVITARKNFLIGVLVADCVPVLLYDKVKEVIGAVHAGWRGTAGRILPDTIKMMHEKFSSSPEDISVAIGPSIKQCCYEVGEEVTKRLLDATGDGDYYIKKDGNCFVDIAFANKMQALDTGIPHENLWLSGECTFCNPDKYHSYRYSKENAGRQGGFIGMW
ncbi:laccase domain protein [bacterium BMS3Abin09]|nr:laccase domain protein [bacterium BMS3Abin09]HDH34272.1 peptidoglycan editing factor PgeF [Nitrospirota bacterium]